MGNFCSSREDLQESRRQYEHYTFLRQQILSKLGDDLQKECRSLYKEECCRRRVPALSKSDWEEVCLPFIQRVSCKDVGTQQRIFAAVQEVYPGPPERAVNEATFVEFNRLALTLAEQDLRQRIAKLKEKFGGDAPPIPANTHLDWFADLLGKEEELSKEPLQISPRSGDLPSESSRLPPLQTSALRQALPPAGADGCLQPAGQRLVSASPARSEDDVAGSAFQSQHSLGQVSYVLKSPRPSPEDSVLGSRASLTSEASVQRRMRDTAQVAEMRSTILRGELEVMVFNKRLQPEPRRLGLNPAGKRMSILRTDGACEDSWDIDHLQCISFGIASNILPKPPPAEKTLSFRFQFQKYGNEARYMCAMFEEGSSCRAAAAAFSQLCGVPVTAADAPSHPTYHK
ncbi:unnamed protein product [Effrenium voratum]|uniref:Uncharacterized protein n=1 Tax=Effrenium voratum TaxID=2562239 RepID=A0AA36JHN7_9DINO|nr:unnamed protein product [Effrenium voratum]